METFRCSAVLTALLIQGTAPPPTPETLAVVRRDTLDGPAQVAVGRAYLERLEAYHAQANHADTAWERGMLDTADLALSRAAAALGAPRWSATADSARVLRVRGWTDRSLGAWETSRIGAGPGVWGPVPSDVRLPPVLEELGENLLRACPPGGVLLTASDADTYAAWYMRYVRGLGSDRLVVPFAVWRDDAKFRAHAASDLRLGPRGAGDAWLAALAERRPVCVSMAFAHPPDSPHGKLKWKARPLVWVAGPVKHDPVAPRDFVFAAVQGAIAERDPWGQAALAVYGRAAHATPALCDALAAFGVPGESTGCRQ